MIVLDASAALELLLRAREHPRLVDRVLRSGETIAAPHVIDVEVAHVLRRFVMTGELAEARAREAIEDHRALGICRYPVSPCRGPPTDWGELVQAHDDREAVQVSPDELPVIDIHGL